MVPACKDRVQSYDSGMFNSAPPQGTSSPEGEKPTIPEHELLRCIGRGSYGEVWLAKNVFGTHRAVKIVHRKTFKGNERPFEREFNGIRKFDPVSRTHPGLVSILQIGRNDEAGYFYYVMELGDDASGSADQVVPEKYVPKTLNSELAKHQKLPLDKCLEIALGLAAGLHHLHKQGLVHRDVKPSNIIFLHGVPKFADIGLVTDIGEAVTFVGTEFYVPPEGPGKPLADLYALGKVLYEMVTGKNVQDFPEFPTPPHDAHDPRLQKFHHIVLQSCHRDPTKRIQSAEQLKEQLTELIDNGRRPRADLGAASPTPAQPITVGLLLDSTAQLDVRLAGVLRQRFAKEKLHVFTDSHPPGSVDWAKQLEERMAKADVLVVLLSETSVKSEMLAYELEMARDAAHQRQGKPRLLGVGVQWHGPPPDAFVESLEMPENLHWNGPQDDDRIANEIFHALFAQKKPRPKLETSSGAVPLDSVFYVVREADHEFESALAKQDSVVLVKGARQMGKTSLLARGLQHARDRHFKVISTDLQKLNVSCFESLENLFIALSYSISDQLKLDKSLQDIWDPRRSANTNFEKFMRREVLDKVSPHLVWGLDEVDRLFGCSFSSEVFGLFRAWHNDRALDPAGPWSRLTLAIAYATEAHLFISDMNQSPFNVGTRVVLDDFSAMQVTELNQRHDNPLATGADLERFIHLVGGQPFLVRKGLNEFSNREWDIDAFETEADSDEGIFADHLRRILVSLTKDPAMMEVVRSVLKGEPAMSSEHFYRLRSAGVMIGESVKELRPRCQLYERYLKRHLL